MGTAQLGGRTSVGSAGMWYALTAYCPLPTTRCSLPTTYSQLPTTHYLQPATHYPLPAYLSPSPTTLQAAYCLLPTRLHTCLLANHYFLRAVCADAHGGANATACTTSRYAEVCLVLGAGRGSEDEVVGVE